MNTNKILRQVVILLFAVVFFYACSSKKDAAEEKASKTVSLSVPKNVETVIGIGRILPEAGIVNLASEEAGIITSVKKKSGDIVKQGEIILSLNQAEAALELQKMQNELISQQHLIQVEELATNQYQLQLKYKNETLKTSEKLAESGNETFDNIQNYRMERDVLQNQLNQSIEKLNIEKAKLTELKVLLELAKNKLEKLNVRASLDGVLLTQDTKLGEALQKYQAFATLAPDSPMIVEGEADEMFANRLKIGQQVSIHYLGNAQIIAEGTISYLSPDLNNKSLFNDEPDELQDRRVRRFKVKLTKMDNLLLNSKVECNIQIQ